MVTRSDILKYVEDNYETKPEYLWARDPGSAVLRHRQNRKWYGIIMDVPRNKVGLDGDEIIDILDLKGEPEMIAHLVTQKGFCPGYHMNKQHWLTIILDGTVEDEEIYNLIDISYEMTK
ncbi:MAG: MmcQ/YjbR family DNA-binding protein [Lachnospiraceae bacterium]|nr:MmcQ/YjbR family DNA-binding protein [Lachnospiraceae bacterium]